MTAHIVIDWTPFEWRVARLEDDQVTDLRVMHPLRQYLPRGKIVRGKIKSIDRRLKGAFVDLGGAMGFLRLGGGHVAEGERIIAEVRREAVAGKVVELARPAVWRQPAGSLAMDGSAYPGPLPMDENAVEGWLSPHRDAFDTWCEAKTLDAFPGQGDLSCVLMSMDLQGVEHIDVTHREARDGLGQSVPSDFQVRIVEPKSVRRLMEEAVEDALRRVIPLPGGGRLVIDEGEALTAVDLDMGTQSGQSAKGAADRLLGDALASFGYHARQAGLGGQFVIDIPRAAIASPKIIRDRLTRALKPLGRVSVPAVSPEGIAVIIAPKHGPSLLDRMTVEAEAGIRPGRVLAKDCRAAGIFREIEAELSASPTARVERTLPADMTAYFGEGSQAHTVLQDRYGGRVTFHAEGGEA